MAKRWVGVGALLLWTACTVVPPTPAQGLDCDLLLEVTRRALACDPALEPLLAIAKTGSDENECRIAARSLLTSTAAVGTAQVQSLYAPPSGPAHIPLTQDERSALGGLEFPATIELVPDLRGEPGLTPTRAWLGERELPRVEDGRLRATALPGLHTLRVKHGADEREQCVRLRECERLDLVLHGAHTAKHKDVRQGRCEGTGR